MFIITDTQEAPRTLLLDSSSSMESLCSTGSATSTSNFSKGSTPPTSPNYKKKSFFNPAEVEKMATAGKLGQVRRVPNDTFIVFTLLISFRNKLHCTNIVCYLWIMKCCKHFNLAYQYM